MFQSSLLSHQANREGSPARPGDEKTAEGFNQIFSGMEQAMSGFFDSWSPFMLTSPFPEVASEYSLEESENQYHLSKTGAPLLPPPCPKKTW